MLLSTPSGVLLVTHNTTGVEDPLGQVMCCTTADLQLIVRAKGHVAVHAAQEQE